MLIAAYRQLLIATIVFAAVCIAMPFIRCEALDDEGDIRNASAENGEKYESASADSTDNEDSLCGSCGKAFPLGENACPECGWPKGGLSPSPEFSRLSFEISEVNTHPVEVIFKGLAILDGGNPEKPEGRYWLIHLKWGDGDKIECVPFGNVFHGYRVSGVEKAKNAAGEENWQLTLEHCDGKITNIGLNISTLLDESYAVIKTDINDKSIPASKVYEGDTFKSKGRIYKIQDISGQRILINDIAGFAFIVKMSR